MSNLTKILCILILSLTLSFSLCALSFADIPHLINYQGKLTDKDNKPVADGTYPVTFRIYDAETAGNLLWEEKWDGASGRPLVSAYKGIFSVMLGGVNPLNLDFSKPYWLELNVSNETMSPRQRIASVGYSYRAETANNADKISNIEASQTPQANKLLPLDANSKLPAAALKVYDSGWFPVTAGSKNYVKTHNLGTTKALFVLYYATNASGNGMSVVGNDNTHDEGTWGGEITDITATQCTARTWPDAVVYSQIYGRPGSGYYRIVGIALE